MPKPTAGTYPAYFERYVSHVLETELMEAFKNQQDLVSNYFISLEAKAEYAYAPGKWTLKEMLQHLIDTERIFNYRSLAFARKEAASLPGFDENEYAAHSHANERNWKSLCEELIAVRKATEIMYESFTPEMLNRTGLANNNPTTVTAMGFISVGHLYHHKEVIETRYL